MSYLCMVYGIQQHLLVILFQYNVQPYNISRNNPCTNLHFYILNFQKYIYNYNLYKIRYNICLNFTTNVATATIFYVIVILLVE